MKTTAKDFTRIREKPSITSSSAKLAEHKPSEFRLRLQQGLSVGRRHRRVHRRRRHPVLRRFPRLRSRSGWRAQYHLRRHVRYQDQLLMRAICLAALLALLIPVLTACGFEPMSVPDPGGLRPGPGLITGKTGEFTIVVARPR